MFFRLVSCNRKHCIVFSSILACIWFEESERSTLAFIFLYACGLHYHAYEILRTSINHNAKQVVHFQIQLMEKKEATVSSILSYHALLDIFVCFLNAYVLTVVALNTGPYLLGTMFADFLFLFQTKFMPGSMDTTIVSCARDGHVSCLPVLWLLQYFVVPCLATYAKHVNLFGATY